MQSRIKFEMAVWPAKETDTERAELVELYRVYRTIASFELIPEEGSIKTNDLSVLDQTRAPAGHASIFFIIVADHLELGFH